MPASGGDLVSTTLRLAFTPGSKVGDLDCGIEASAKRVLLTRIEYEPATNYQSSVLNTLKSKYIVVNTKPTSNNNKTFNGTNVNNKKSNNNITLPVPKLTLFPPERVQLGYRGNLSVGSGMSNMGNTCYLNSTLQALFHVPALVNWLVSETAHQNCVQNSDFQMHPDDITCSVIKTFKCSQQKTGNCMKPISVYSKLKAICKHLSHGSQEDAHEFMRYLLESLEKNYLTRFQGHKLDSTSKETTPINQIFGGYIRTEVVCLQCRAVSTTFQHFQDLPLDIRKASTLNDALAGYFERERLPDGEDAYKCEKCNKKVSVTKKFSIEKPPNVLCVQLKRFSMTNGKITKQVQLPQFLDITRFISPNVQPRHPVKYKLVSMVTHMGQSINCGHYTAIALAANGSYYQFDDSSVRQIPLSTVLNMSAYLILYEMERPFQAVNPRPYPAPSTVVWNGNSNSGEEEENWPRTETPAVSNSSCIKFLLNENKRLSEDDVRSKESKEDKITSKSLQFNKPALLQNINGYSNGGLGSNKSEEKNSLQKNEKTESNESNKKESHSAVCQMLERDLQRKRDVINSLLQSSHWGYGSSTVKSWNGTQSALVREVNEEKSESTKRTLNDLYNEDFDRGKVKKLKTNSDRDRPRYNLFQKKQQQKYQEKMNYYHWRGNNGNHGRYGNDFRNSFKRPYNGQFNGNNNWNYSKKNYKFFKVPRSGRKGLGVSKYFRPLPGKIPGLKKSQSSG